MLLHNNEARDLSSLELLENAPSKAFVETLFVRVFQTRQDGFTNSFILSVAQALYGVNAEEEVSIAQEQKAHECLEAILFLIQQSVFHNLHALDNADKLASELFSPKRVTNFKHVALMKLIVGLVKKHGDSWRRASAESLIGLPKLQQMKWRVDMKSASHSITGMNAPVVVVELDALQNISHAQSMPQNETVQFELNRETLEIMLGGLTKIRDQLSAVK